MKRVPWLTPGPSRAQSLPQQRGDHPVRDESNFERPDPDGPNFDDDDSELDTSDELWDPLDLDEDDEEPEPEYGDFWLEPDDFED